jgi:ethanolamine ammonia-lyase large subunit
MPRRTFIASVLGGASACVIGRGGRTAQAAEARAGVVLSSIQRDEDVFEFIRRTKGDFDVVLYRQILGAANEFKEGDALAGIAAADADSRASARQLLRNARIRDFLAHPVFEDALSQYMRRAVDDEVAEQIADWTFGELADFLLASREVEIKRIMPGLSSDVIACVVKLMTNDELIAVGSSVFNPLPGSKLGARGYMAARIQPNSPTDNVDDIQWQVYNGWSFAVGDALLGTNPVSSEVESVAAVEWALADILQTFELTDVLPHCVLAHIDVQAEVERQYPGSTALWFQSLAGVEDAGATFGISVPKMVQHAGTRSGKYGLYFETGQGADATNGHGKGFDMVIHESRKYGFARALKLEVARAQEGFGRAAAPWVHVNDVAGFIGPEIFRTREQLVRCCLEDIVMGKLHGLTIGLDICSTLHMDVDLDDLDWCIDQIMPAAPAYLMALPTKNDPMLSYLTTAFQDHVRVREKFGYKVNDPMWRFFQQLGVIDGDGQPTEHFGQPTWVYLQYRRKKGDARREAEILAEGREKVAEVRARGVFIAEGFGQRPGDLQPRLDRQVRHLYEDSKKCIWAELPDAFVAGIPSAVPIVSQSEGRADYILHPPTGETLTAASIAEIDRLRATHAGKYDVQIVISDGLDAFALTDDGHLAPYLESVRTLLASAGYKVAPEHVVVHSGRVRAGYRIGERLFGQLADAEAHRAILHVIGERPGSGHHAYSVYITAPPVSTWAKAGTVDHNITKVVSGIADTALPPPQAASDTLRIVQQLAPL